MMYPKKIRKASMNESGTLSTRGTRHSSHRWAPMRDITKAHWPNAPFTDSRTKLGRSWEDRPASPEGGAGLTPIEAIGFHWTGVLMAVLLPLLVACSSCPWHSPASVCSGLAITTNFASSAEAVSYKKTAARGVITTNKSCFLPCTPLTLYLNICLP